MRNWNMSLATGAALAIVTCLCQAAEVSPPTEPMSVWFVSPAKSFHESRPLCNGRLGVMDFGGVGTERLVLNESSLWSGGPYDGNRYDAYLCLPEVRKKLFAGDISGAGGVLGNSFRYADGISGWRDINQFGSYQTLGDLIVDFDSSAEATLSSPSGHSADDGKTVENTVDGHPGSKWCVNNGSASVSWQMRLPAAQTVASYAITSGDDVPDRDPRSWVLEGSTDGKTWVAADRRALDKPFEQRQQAMTFEIARPGAFSFYRFTFAPTPAKTFQVAAITLASVVKASALMGADGYRRDLNLMQGVAHTQYQLKGITFTRALLVSKPDEVIVLNMKADQPGALSFTARLQREQNAATRTDGGVYVLAGQLPFNKPGGNGKGMCYCPRSADR